MQISSGTEDNKGKLRKGIGITLTVILVIFIVLCVTPILALSSRDRAILTQKYKSFQSGGMERQYLIQTPQDIDETTRIIVGIHGFGDSARKFAYYTGLQNVVSSKDIVIYPQAAKPMSDQKNGWNAEFCCGSGWKQEVDDSKYIMDLVKSVRAEFGVDKAKLYVTGFSNGAFMTQRLAIDYPDQIDAIAVMAGSLGTTTRKLEPKTEMPILMMHGEQDKTISVSGGAKPSEPDFDWLPFSTMESAWKAVNKDKAPVKVILYKEDAHIWHDWRIFNVWHRQPEASQEVMKFYADSGSSLGN